MSSTSAHADHSHRHGPKAVRPGTVIFALVGCFLITLVSQTLLTGGGEIERPAMAVHAPVVEERGAQITPEQKQEIVKPKESPIVHGHKKKR